VYNYINVIFSTENKLEKQALIIGIDRYQSLSQLGCATNDAEEIASALTLPEYDFTISLLTNEQANSEFVKQQISFLLSGNANIKLLYFAGHGISIDNSVYICAQDSTLKSPGIDLFDLKKQIASTKGVIFVILDCCHSGAGDIRDIETIKQLTEGDLDRSLGDLSEGKILIASCGQHEKAQESSKLQHGIFTFFLLEGLLGSAANRQGIVTPMSLYDYVSTRMKTEYSLSPILKGEQRGLVVLGAGFSQNIVDTKDSYSLSPTIQKELEDEARIFLDDYFTKTKIPYEEWQSSGYKLACQLLEPILRWFERQMTEYPGITSSRVFNTAYREARSRLSEVGAIDIGYHVDEGVIGNYLGSGAFGSVYRVDREGSKPLAYKIFHAHELNVPEKTSRFYRGYRAMNQLNHPFIVKVHKYTRCPIGFYMDFIDGPNLRDWIGTLDEPEQQISLLVKIAETLKHAHGRNVIHRDIKPENIIMQYNLSDNLWEPYLTDFDLAWFSAATQVTKEAFGTIFYAAPEQLSKPQSRIAHALTTDVYSFGQLCYFMTTGSNPVPFHGADNSRSLRDRILHWKTSEAASKFLEIYSACTQDDPDKRPTDFRDIINSLHESYELLTQIPSEQIFNEKDFIRETSYQIVGLPDTKEFASDGAFNTLSGRTVVEFLDLKIDLSGQYTIQVKLTSLLVAMPGMTNQKARHALNMRLEKSLNGIKDLHKRFGTEGEYHILLTIHRVSPTLSGIEQCRGIIARAIDSLESF
jgi:eukaryotic-like serine/threonine-protein kinase